jgi:hypothetical protein
MRLLLGQMGLEVELDVLTYSKQLYTSLQGHWTATEKRLMMDIAALRKMLHKKEETRVGFVRSQYNMADGLTKELPFDKTSVLTGFLRTGNLPLVVEEFIPREFPVS